MKNRANTEITGLALSYIIFTLYSMAVSFYAETSLAELVFSRLILATLPLSAALCILFSIQGKRRISSSIPFIFLFINSFYVFIHGLSIKFFTTDVSPGLFLYLLQNFFILLEDTSALLPLIPYWYWIIFILTIAAGYKWKSAAVLFISWADDTPVSASGLSALIIISVIIASALLTLAPVLSGPSHKSGTSMDSWTALMPDKQQSETCFKNRRGMNIDDNPDVVIFLFESVGAEYFDPEKSLYLKKGEPVLSVENFFVPVPHTTVSIYSILTGNYGDYRGRIKLPGNMKSSTLPGILKSGGYSTYFLYSGPTYFEGLHSILENTGFTVFNKEYFESSMPGKKYRSFSWGVDDAALLHKTAEMLPDLKGPSFFIIGFSSTHSPYFNPETGKFSTHDNETEKGRYLNSIDYDMFIMDSIINMFLRHNDNTIFIVLGDHGESFGDQGFLRHGFSLYNSEIKVPFYIRHPVFSSAPVYTAGTILDIYPSLLDMLGMETPEQTDGKSFFCEDYKLGLFLRSWKEGENMGFISGDKKFLYSGKNDHFTELDLHDRVIREITGHDEKGSFRDFLNSNY